MDKVNKAIERVVQTATEREVGYRLERAKQLASEIWDNVYLVAREYDTEDYMVFRVLLHSVDGPVHWVAVSSVNSWEMRRN